jgi:hypothetical protein
MAFGYRYVLAPAQSRRDVAAAPADLETTMPAGRHMAVSPAGLQAVMKTGRASEPAMPAGEGGRA